MKYADWLKEWLDDTVKPTVKERTYERYDRIVRNQIVPTLGDYDLCDLSPSVLQAATAEYIKKYATNTVIGVVAVIRYSLQRACEVGILDRQFSGSIKRPRSGEKQVECFTVNEQKKIEEFVRRSGKDKLFGIILCLYTGLRVGELLALKWSDVDLGKGVIFITRSCHDSWDNGRYEKRFDTPKTPTSRRIIPLPKQLIKSLKAVKKRSTDEMLISSDDSEYISVRSYQRTFELILNKLNIPHKGFHAIRHTFATRAVECGMDVKTLSEILGHKNSTITLNRYTHSLLEHKTAMMNKLGKLFD